MTTINTTTIKPTTFGVRDGIDVTVTVDGVQGEALVAPDEVNGGYAVYGNSLDMWLSHSLIRVVGDDRDLAREIAAEACAAAASARL